MTKEETLLFPFQAIDRHFPLSGDGYVAAVEIFPRQFQGILPVVVSEDQALVLARQSGASLEVIHVVDDDHPRQIVEAERREAEKLLHQLTATLREVDEIPCTSPVMLAAPFLGIVQAVEDANPDLFIIGPHRRQSLRDVFIGTTAERTIRSVACPTLMSNALPAGTYRHILLTTDLSAGSRDALHRFPGLGVGKRARKSLLYIFDAPALDLAFSHSILYGDQQLYLAENRKRHREIF